ncbi:Ig-like domain-containing protein [Amycolatopsis sp. Hca4]|uniref:Ig-like domain-containing protein n=1 Tax=Amycolatopsis sp. Hca4 TaxID=2742131 RepID=UPI00159226AD|nr:Ig-like domain-containing protein [Amycolatopsis sp. Hca4]QKV80423.1 Ig-like domain-containing protein [Amycolatopsis sp. Hca4]
MTGTYFDDGTVDNQGHDQFSILQILVDFGANRFPKVAATIGNGTWSATGSIPAGVRHGDVVTLSFDASILALSSSGDQPGGYDVIDTRQVVVEQTGPQVVIDPFQNDVTVQQLPFRVPLLSGRALDDAGVTGVQFTIDGGARQNMDSVTGDPAQVTWSKANVGFGTGQHTVVVIATDAFGNEGTASTTVTVRLNTPPPPPPPPPTGDITFTPTFRHTDWINNVDRIEAGGPNGFNVRYDAIDSDLSQLSTVVGRINTALKFPGVVLGEQRLTPGLDLVSLPAGEWSYDDTGMARPAVAGAQAIMHLSLPEPVALRNFRAIGFYPGPPALFVIRLFRSSLLDQNLPPEELAEIRLDSPEASPFDHTVPVPDAVATVDGSFRHYVTVLSQTTDVSLATIQLTYVAT